MLEFQLSGRGATLFQKRQPIMRPIFIAPNAQILLRSPNAHRHVLNKLQRIHGDIHNALELYTPRNNPKCLIVRWSTFHLQELFECVQTVCVFNQGRTRPVDSISFESTCASAQQDGPHTPNNPRPLCSVFSTTATGTPSRGC